MGSATSPSFSVCCEGKGTKPVHGSLPGLEGHLDSVPRMNFQKVSPGTVQGGEALRGLQGSAPWAAPLQQGLGPSCWGCKGRAPLREGAGSLWMQSATY